MSSQIYHTAATYFGQDEAMKPLNQPDVLSLHVEFLRACNVEDSTVTVTLLKLGLTACTIQLYLHQRGKLKVVALATSTNFSKAIGPSANSPWSMHPPAPPLPDFERIKARVRDEHWLPTHLTGDLHPFTANIITMAPRQPYPADNICHSWNNLLDGQNMDASYLPMLADLTPSLYDTLMHTGSMHDGHAHRIRALQSVDKDTGIPISVPNSFKDAMACETINATMTMDYEFKQRLPEQGQEWVFTRATTKMVRDGRMDMEVLLCNEKLELLCICQQIILITESRRKFRPTMTPKAAL